MTSIPPKQAIFEQMQHSHSACEANDQVRSNSIQYRRPLLKNEAKNQNYKKIPSNHMHWVITLAFGNCFNFSLLTISSTKFKSAYLKGQKAVGHFNHVNQTVQVIGGQDEAVSLGHDTPTTHEDISGKTSLK